MTLPFRRRHNDAEASHDRARSIIATGLLEPTAPADAAWLEDHLQGCADCQADLRAFAEDRELIRGLRSAPPEPPRDLWARTAASIEREAGRHDAARRHGPSRRPGVGGGGPGGPRILRLPLGVLSGVLVVLVVVATSFFPRGATVPLGPTPPGSDVAVLTPGPAATPLAVSARALSWVAEQSDGTYQLVFANVREVCVSNPDACAPIDEAGTTHLDLASEPDSMLLAPDSRQLVIVTKLADTGESGGEVIVVPVTTPPPSLDPGATPTPTLTSGPTPEMTPTETPSETPTATPTATRTLGPDETVGPTTAPTPTRRPDGSLAILEDVVVVGEAAYSEDGRWLAFSARPADGSSGPDLYLWAVGADEAATPLTSDHRTFFAGWLGNRILASRVVTAGSEPDDPAGSPAASSEPGAAPSVTATPGPGNDRTAKPDKTSKPGRSPSPGAPGQSGQPAESGAPGGSPAASPAPFEDHPVSFLLDPATSPATVIELTGLDIWRPVVDPASRTIVYWSGTLVPDDAGTGWDLGTGQLVIDGWVDPASPDADASPGASATTEPTATPDGAGTAPTPDPSAGLEPTSSPGPAGSPVVLADGPMSGFEVRFDPTGTRLAVWIRDASNPSLGTLRLLAIDPATGRIDPDVDPLPAATALRGFSIGEGRLAWVTPPGQDGESSHVQVLGWNGDDFGQIRSIAADRLFVVR